MSAVTMASKAAVVSLTNRTSAAILRQRWRWKIPSASPPLFSGSLRLKAEASNSTDSIALDGLLPAAQSWSWAKYHRTYATIAKDLLSSNLALASIRPSDASLLLARPLQTPPSGAAVFTTEATKLDEQVGDGEDSETEVDDAPQTKTKKSSLLQQLPESYTPAMAYNLICSNRPKGTGISQRDFRSLCMSARPGVPRDARLIAHALVVYRSRKSLKVDSFSSRMAMEGMVRAMTPKGEGVTPEQKAEAVIWALERGWLDDRTGVYFAYPTKGIDNWLETLLECLRESKGSIQLPDGFDHTTDLVSEKKGKGEDNNGEDDDEDKKDDSSLLAVSILRTVKHTIHRLIQRGALPGRKMKKRAARKYRNSLCLTPEEGNATPLTADLGVRIALELGGTSKCARDCALTEFRKRRNKDLPETGLMVQRKEKEEQEEKREKWRAAQLEAAAAEKAAEWEGATVGSETEVDDEGGNKDS